MTEVDYIWKNEARNRPGYFEAQITASDLETVTVNFPIRAAVLHPNVDNAETSSWGVTFTAGAQVAVVNLTGNTSDVACTIILTGDA